MSPRPLLLVAALLWSAILPAQSGGLVFDDDVLHRIEVDIPIAAWLDTLDRDYSQNAAFPDSIPEIYRPCTVRFDGIEIAGCGIRERGNSTNSINAQQPKKPFKIAFDHAAETRFDGLKKINLNNFTNDPSLVREATVYRMHRMLGTPAPRTAYAELHVNGAYWGLYLIVENVDKTFLRDHYGSQANDGNLYKTTRSSQAYLAWEGSAPEAYQDGLKLTTNEDLDDWTGLITFIDRLNHSPDSTFRQVLPAIFNLEGYLKVLAVEKLTKSWDSYWGGGNNYYLYEHPDGRMHWIPWDVNETFQDLNRLDWTKLLDGYLIPTRNREERPLLHRIFSVPEWRSDYLHTVCATMATTFNVDSIAPAAARWHTLIRDAYARDPHRLNSFSAFDGALHEENMEILHVLQSGYAVRLRYNGILPVVQRQREWAANQMSEWDEPCARSQPRRLSITPYPNPTSGEMQFVLPGAFDYADLSILDSQGRLVVHYPWRAWEGAEIALDLGNLQPGLYIIRKVSANGDVATGRVVVMH